MKVASTNALEVGDMVRFTKNSKNSGKTAKVIDLKGDLVILHNSYGLLCEDGSIESEAAIDIDSQLIEKI